MADTTTTNLGLTKPEPGAAEDTWGISLNNDLDAIDAIFSGTGTAVSLNIDGGDIASAVTINKSPVITLGGDLSGNVTLTNLGNGTLTATVGTLNQSTTGNAATATALATGRNFSLTGNVTASAVSFDGTGNVALATTLADSTVTSAKLSGALTTPSDLTVGGAFTSQGIDDNATATAITIDSSRNVGIGTSSPGYFLDVNGGSGTMTRFTSGGSSTYLAIKNTSNTGYVGINGTSMELYPTGSLAMTLDQAGSVGIGMTPFTGYTGYSLQIGGTSQTFISIHNNTTGNTVNDGFSLGNDASNVYLTNRENTPMIFSTNNSERMRIGNQGYVFINTTSTHATNARLYVGGANSAITGMAIVNDNDSGTIYSMYVLNASNSLVGGISNNGSSTTFHTSSDYRLKENVNYDWNGTEKLKQLKPAQFNFISNADETVEGFIAHETEGVAPYAVIGEKDGEKMQGMDYGRITPILVKAIQEQQAIIEDLKSRIETLEE